VVIEASSNVGAILFATDGVTGVIEGPLEDDGLVVTSATARVEVPVDQLTSGNALYDGELHRRIDVRRFPRSTVELRAVDVAPSGRYRVTGDISFHGTVKELSGEVSVVLDGERVVVTGEEDLDIRHFGMAAPSMLMLRIEPRVRVQLHVEGVREA
jgi:polyisoprenoid-binding protein YceI